MKSAVQLALPGSEQPPQQNGISALAVLLAKPLTIVFRLPSNTHSGFLHASKQKCLNRKGSFDRSLTPYINDAAAKVAGKRKLL